MARALLLIAALALCLAVATALKFKHPGILVNRNMLEFVRKRVEAKVEPWNTAFAAMAGSQYANLDWTPKPRESVNCGPYNQPDEGCTDERYDAFAAYTHALMWYFTKNIDHAAKAREIMDAWSAVHRAHTLANAPLMVAWSGEMFPRAAEIIRYTTPKGFWPASSVTRFESMLKRAYLPYIIEGRRKLMSGGNWEISMAEAVMNIGIFTNNAKVFARGVKLWKERIPAYFYHKKDGKTPVKPPGSTYTPARTMKYWYNQKPLVTGLTQETCRDIIHTHLGLSGALNGAETAYLQGVDLYSLGQRRLIPAMEMHAKYVGGFAPVPSWLCNGSLKIEGPTATYEIGYNHYAIRLKKSLPFTKRFLSTIRPFLFDLV